MADLMARYRATWVNYSGWVQQIIVDKSQGTIKAEVENVHSRRNDPYKVFAEG